jgi:hypothetical protein
MRPYHYVWNTINPQKKPQKTMKSPKTGAVGGLVTHIRQGMGKQEPALSSSLPTPSM